MASNPQTPSVPQKLQVNAKSWAADHPRRGRICWRSVSKVQKQAWSGGVFCPPICAQLLNTQPKAREGPGGQGHAVREAPTITDQVAVPSRYSPISLHRLPVIGEGVVSSGNAARVK